MERGEQERLVGAAVDWPMQARDFARDGSLRDIYVLETSIEEWKVVIDLIMKSLRWQLTVGGVAASMPAEFGDVFLRDGVRCSFFCFKVGAVGLQCHFFTPHEIEFSFGPEDVTEASLRDLLRFMLDVGDAIRRPVIMTPENRPEEPIFKFDPATAVLTWCAPAGSAR